MQRDILFWDKCYQIQKRTIVKVCIPARKVGFSPSLVVLGNESVKTEKFLRARMRKKANFSRKKANFSRKNAQECARKNQVRNGSKST